MGSFWAIIFGARNENGEIEPQTIHCFSGVANQVRNFFNRSGRQPEVVSLVPLPWDYTGFPFEELPAIYYELVLKCLKPDDLMSLSLSSDFCSVEVREFIRRNLKLKNISFNFLNENKSITINGQNANWTCNWYFYCLSCKPSSEKLPERTINGAKYYISSQHPIRGSTSHIVYCEDVRHGFGEFLNYVLSIFNAPFGAVLWDDQDPQDTMEMLDFINEKERVIETLCIMNTYQCDPSQIDYIFSHIKAKHFVTHLGASQQLFAARIYSFDRLELCFSRWITAPRLRRLHCHTMVLRESKLFNHDVEKLLKFWMRNELFSGLRCIMIEFLRANLNKVVRSVQSELMNPEDIARMKLAIECTEFASTTSLDIPIARQINRADGALAFVFFHDNFHLSINNTKNTYFILKDFARIRV